MKPQLLVLVTSDPRTSGRPAEAIRIAAGVGTWKKIEVSVYLRGPAIRSLSEFADELVDEDNFNRYLPILGEFGRPVYLQQGAPELSDLGTSPVPFVAITDDQLAELVKASTYSLRF